MKNVLMLEISPMKEKDLLEVEEIEKRSFADPYSHEMFLQELANRNAYYIVGSADNKIICYAGFWRIFDEGHIMSIAVHPDARNMGYGSAILQSMMQKAKSLGIKSMTLEVRVSNSAAQSLYIKHGFKVGGLRRGYYTDNDEDALIMWNNDITNT